MKQKHLKKILKDVKLYANGNIKEGLLTENATIEGIEFIDDELELYENGNVRHGVLKRDQKINGITFTWGFTTYFYENGKVMPSISWSTAKTPSSTFPFS